jgi:hypothetical protein
MLWYPSSVTVFAAIMYLSNCVIILAQKSHLFSSATSDVHVLHLFSHKECKYPRALSFNLSYKILCRMYFHVCDC